jgi:hypothetical protein
MPLLHRVLHGDLASSFLPLPPPAEEAGGGTRPELELWRPIAEVTYSPVHPSSRRKQEGTTFPSRSYWRSTMGVVEAGLVAACLAGRADGSIHFQPLPATPGRLD